MKILFMRHGQSIDDIENRYGGWADYPLTEKGQEDIRAKISLIKNLNEQFEAIYSSPFKRAFESASILSELLLFPLFPFEFLKERNTYGILSGMSKEEAKKKYPELVERGGRGEYIYGSERYEDLVERVKKCLELLESQPYKSIIAITHGNFLKCLCKEFAGTSVQTVGDGGFILTELTGNKLNILTSEGVNFK